MTRGAARRTQGFRVSSSAPTEIMSVIPFERPEDPGLAVVTAGSRRWDDRRGRSPASWVTIGGLLAGLVISGALLLAAWDAL